MSTSVVLPGGMIGIVGGGQLGRMLALEARRMGYRTAVLDPDPEAPAAHAADVHIRAPLGDAAAALELARLSDVVTLEWENADVQALRLLAEQVPVHPSPDVLAVAQHRVREKDAARRLGLPTAEYAAVGTLEELTAALEAIGTPAVLKTARGGYDGRGQVVVRRAEEADAAFRELGGGSRELILEQWVRFRSEVSVICARTARGEVACFPVGENHHERGILESTQVPAALSEALQLEARRIGEAMAEGLGVVGLLAVELFVTEDDRLLVNEIAPRPHNSGHYTWEACATSQFEQQLRAVCGLPLGSTELLRPAAMVNLLGEHLGDGGGGESDWPAALADPLVTLHLYGKREARVGRKMGHLTALGATATDALQRALAARARLRGRG